MEGGGTVAKASPVPSERESREGGETYDDSGWDGRCFDEPGSPRRGASLHAHVSGVFFVFFSCSFLSRNSPLLALLLSVVPHVVYAL